MVSFFALSFLTAGFAVSPNPLEVGGEWVDAGDVTLLQGSWVGDFVLEDWESTLSLAYGHYSMNYVPAPFDFRGMDQRRNETNLAVQLNTQKQVRNDLSLMGGAGVYDGFTNYRSVWLDEYFRQQYSDLPGVPGAENYVEADPKGVNATVGARWEYKPGTGFAQVDLSWLEDDVSPGYEIDFDGLRRGRLQLHTGSVSISTENVLTPRVRSYVVLRSSKTSERSTRYGADASLYVAVVDDWIMRWNAGAASENPQFEAAYISLALEHQIEEGISWFVDGRYYEDTGEIENALLFTTAAPGLASERFGLGFRWIGDNWSSRFYLARLRTDYDPTREDLDFFQNLYRDRDWDIIQVALSRRF